MKLENFFSITIGLAVLIFGILKTESLSTTTIIILISFLGLIIFALTMHLFIDRYYKIKSKLNGVAKKVDDLKYQFEIEKRLSLIEARLSKK